MTPDELNRAIKLINAGPPPPPSEENPGDQVRWLQSVVDAAAVEDRDPDPIELVIALAAHLDMRDHAAKLREWNRIKAVVELNTQKIVRLQ